MTPDTAEIVERAFAALRHGDAEHQAWLRDALDCFFNGRPVPAPRGSGNKEALIESLTAENERMREALGEARLQLEYMTDLAELYRRWLNRAKGKVR